MTYKSNTMEDIRREHNAKVAEKEKREKESKKYFLIEEYRTMSEDWSDKIEYEINRYDTPVELQQAIMKGPKHQGGTLIPLQKLEAALKLKKPK